jgi:MFS transporter, BCD family, chlorophyll transporter
MSAFRKFALNSIAGIAPRFLPFADVATNGVPLSRLLRLSLFQVTVGMALVLLVGTLNRVMIVELQVPAALVGIMLALPLLFAPFRALIGFRSDHHRSALGWRRVPYIWKGTLLQFGGFAIMPFALLVLSGFGEAIDAPVWIGRAAAGLAFLLVGAGLHMVQTVGLALATDLVREEDHPNVVGLMYVMLLVGMIGSAWVFGWLLQDYSPLRLIQVIQGAAVVTIVLNAVALWKQEPRNRERANAPQPRGNFKASLRRLTAAPGMTLLLAIIALGTAGFGMADVLLEPFGGQALAMSVADTTRLTVVLAAGSLVGFAFASWWLGRMAGSAARMAAAGAAIGMPAFGLILYAAGAGSVPLFIAAVAAAGLGAGLFGHGTLTATLQTAPRSERGLALGTWGAVQTTAAGLAVAGAGITRDVILARGDGTVDPAAPYLPVFGFEILLLASALALTILLLRRLDGGLLRTSFSTNRRAAPLTTTD